ncbi:alpha/beta hydrolase [Clostridium cavendishii]|nr:alpha/beta hydrolase [Clostridium cavendishii]
MRENFYVEDRYGKKINVYKWYSDKEAKAIIQISHGMSETAIRYDYFAEMLVKKGYIVYAHDHRGHGYTAENKNELGYIADNDGFNVLVQNLYDITKFIKNANVDKKIILFGHSMGSFISQRYLEEHAELIDGLILSGTNGKPISGARIGAALAGIEIKLYGRKHKSKLLDKLSFGNFNNNFKPNRTAFDWLCSDKLEVDKYIEDPLCGFICTSSFYYDLLNGLKDIHKKENLNKIPKDIPIYIFAGDKDPVGNCGKGIINLYNIYKLLNIKDVNYKLYKEGRHEMLNEVSKDEVIEDIQLWLNKVI